MSEFVLFMGSARGGATSLAGIASALGLMLGDELLGTRDYAPLGLFENRRVMRINADLLGHHDLSEHSAFPLPAGWQSDAAGQLAALRARRLLASFGEGQPFGLRDPRLLLTSALWRSQAEALGHEVRFVIGIDPVPEAGAGSVLGWLAQMTMAEAASCQAPRLLVPHSRLVDAPMDVAGKLKAFCGLGEGLSKSERAEVSSFAAIEAKAQAIASQSCGIGGAAPGVLLEAARDLHAAMLEGDEARLAVLRTDGAVALVAALQEAAALAFRDIAQALITTG